MSYLIACSSLRGPSRLLQTTQATLEPVSQLEAFLCSPPLPNILRFVYVLRVVLGIVVGRILRLNRDWIPASTWRRKQSSPAHQTATLYRSEVYHHHLIEWRCCLTGFHIEVPLCFIARMIRCFRRREFSSRTCTSSYRTSRIKKASPERSIW